MRLALRSGLSLALLPVLAGLSNPPLHAAAGGLSRAATSLSRITEIYVSPFNMIGPSAIATDRNRHRAYAVLSTPGRLWVLDTAGNQQIASLTTDGLLPTGVAVNPNNGLVYITNQGSSFISVYDPATNAWRPHLEVGSPTVGIALQPARNRAYVTTYGKAVLLVNLSNGRTRALRDPSFKMTKDIAVDTYALRAYVQNEGNNTISVIDTHANTVIDTIDTGRATNAVAVDSTLRRVFVGHDDGTLSLFDATGDADTLVATIPVSSGISDVAVNPGLARAYATNFLDNTVSEIDSTTNHVISTTPVGVDPIAISVDQATKREYVASYYADYVSVLGE